MEKIIPIEVSARHIHLSPEDLESLFGKGYQLSKLKDLTQPSDFAAKETVDISANGREIKGLRVVGPTRNKTQVELSLTDAFYLGIETPVKISGGIEGTPGAVLKGPEGSVKIKEGVITPQRHIHCSLEEAGKLGIKDGEEVSVKVAGERSLTFHNIKVRAGKDYRLCFHLDTDEGNSAGISKKGEGILL